MPGHGKREKFNSISGAQISEELRALGLSVGDVSRHTGANPDRVILWINDEEKAPQMFVSWLAMARVPGALEASHQRSEQLRLK